jgi:hypothetical protein
MATATAANSTRPSVTHERLEVLARRNGRNFARSGNAVVRVGQADYFRQELWDRKGKWKPVWEKFRQEIVDAGGDNYLKLTRLLANLNAVYKGKPVYVTRLCWLRMK